MANNPYVNKIVYGNNTLIDLTSDTVEANKMLKGVTAHDKAGATIVGTLALTITVTYDSTFYNKTITCTKGQTVYTQTTTNSGTTVFEVDSEGLWTISCNDVTRTVDVSMNVDLSLTITKTILIYSGANDTVVFTDVSGSKTCVTNADGEGAVSITYIPNSTIWFESTVVSRPDDPTIFFKKKVKMTPELTEIYVMPEGEVLYWYGYKNNNHELEYATSANGWTGPSGYSTTFYNPEENSDNLYTASYSTGAVYSAIGTKDYFVGKSFNTICKTVQYYPLRSARSSKKTYDNIDADTVVKTTDDAFHFTEFDISQMGNVYCSVGSVHQYKSKWYALWINPLDSQKTPTFTSASWDVLYIKENGNNIPIAYTNIDGRSYDALLPSGTYTIYSSIAKDPNNLNNSYSKTVTIDENTQTVSIMPENAVYWYGYKSDLFQECTSANGWSSVTYTGWHTNWNYDTNSIYIHHSGTGASYVAWGTKEQVYASKVHSIVNSAQSGDQTDERIGITTNKVVNQTGNYATVSGLGLQKVTYENQNPETPVYCYSGEIHRSRDLRIYALWYDDVA